MPELPEVETVRLQLEKQILAEEVESVSQSKLNLRKPFLGTTKKLKGQKIESLTRWGKRLFIHLDGGAYFDVSLGMTGAFRFEEISSYKKVKHDHIQINFKNGQKLIYNDPRRFGWFEFKTVPFEAKGWDPLLSPLKEFKNLIEKAKKTEVNAYTFLMDQKNIVGLGNIYVQEILFKAGVSPFRKIKSCSAVEMLKIRKHTNKILSKSLAHGGSTILNYKNAKGESGSFQKKLHVYGKKKSEPCSKCKMAIKYVQKGRAICYCPQCQV